MKLSCLVLFLCILFVRNSRAELKSLSEVIDVGTSKAFGEIYETKSRKGNAFDMLKLLQDKTEVDNDYLEAVVLKAAEAETLSDLETKTFNMTEAVQFINKVIKHFQKNPNAGRADKEDTTSKNKEEL